MISNAGIQLIKFLERFRATPYTDGNKQAIGYGHNFKPGESWTRITEAEATDLLIRDAADAEAGISSCVSVPLSQPQLDALISLVFNWGPGNFCRSALVQALNSGDYAGAAAKLRAGPVTEAATGRVLSSLVSRRAREADLFLSGTGGPAVDPSTADPGAFFDPAEWFDAEPTDGMSTLGLVGIAIAVLVVYLIVSD